MIDVNELFKDKVILVTGGCGSIGSEIVRQLIDFKPGEIRVLDNSESKQFHFIQEIKSDIVKPMIGDVRDYKRVKSAIKSVDLVFHAAALKHVPLCEFNCIEAVNTNVIGTQNVVSASIEEEVERFISISTDKAVHPINTMGATKLLSEKIVLNASRDYKKPLFCSVRFGNVLESDGSVIPIFEKQIKEGSTVTITSKHMTRFFMSMSEAVNLVLEAAEKTQGGEIFILNMKSLKIIDLAKTMVEELAPRYGYDPEKIKIEAIGIRPGEKLHESLFTGEEAPFVEKQGDLFILKVPEVDISSLKGEVIDDKKIVGFNSNNSDHINQEEIKKFFRNREIINNQVVRKSNR